MIAHRIYAFIKDGEVENTIICEDYRLAKKLAKDILGDDVFAVEITQIPTSIGDTFIDGIFYNKEGDVIEPLATAEQLLSSICEDNKNLKILQEEQDDIIMNIILEGL